MPSPSRPQLCTLAALGQPQLQCSVSRQGAEPYPGAVCTLAGTRPRDRGLGEVGLGGEAGGFRAGGGAYFAVDRAEMGIYGPRAYEEFTGYLGVGHALRDEPENLHFPVAQARRVGRL